MNQKELKKTIKRQTARKRAQRQTVRRDRQLKAGRNNTQVAQDIYEPIKATKGKPKGIGYKLREYDYDMFGYGDPVKVGGRASPAIRKSARRSGSQNQTRNDIKKEQKRKALWVEKVRSMREEKKKTKRQERKKRRKTETKRVKRTTSRKSKMS